MNNYYNRSIKETKFDSMKGICESYCDLYNAYRLLIEENNINYNKAVEFDEKITEHEEVMFQNADELNRIIETIEDDDDLTRKLKAIVESLTTQLNESYHDRCTVSNLWNK